VTERVTHEIYAVKFGRNEKSVRGSFMMGAAAEPFEQPMPIDYFVWAIRSPGQDVVLDAGFTSVTNQTRQRKHLEDPSVALARIGVDPATVPFVILSHLHYDHVGDLDPFTTARFVLQQDELEFWTGEMAQRIEFSRHIEPGDIARVRELNAASRVLLVDGMVEVVDGIWVVKIGGHTPGLQVTLVRTSIGVVVLAADGSHFFENIEQDRPFAVVTNLIDMYAGYDRMKELATSGLVVAGHDPLLFDRFPAVPGQEGRVLRIA
jgi:glyoxylase-like metal-dependent hydrolase (beta-lactamase superfamily II)